MLRKVIRAARKVKWQYENRGIHHINSEEWKADILQRKISLGKFLENMEESNDFTVKNVTFLSGGSGVLDYLFLKEIMHKYGLKNYLEIGTYIGESISCMEDVCEKRISITVPPEHPKSMQNYCKAKNMVDFSNRLVRGGGIVQCLEDSRNFDFKKIKDTVDLYFIDADHSYKGVYNDTSKVFGHKQNKSFVIWHDFAWDRVPFNIDVVQAVADSIGMKQFRQVYYCDNNLCGIYVPKEYQPYFDELCQYDKNVLYTYDVKLKIGKH